VARVEACLLDAFGTIVTCGFTAHTRELPVLAGIPADAVYEEFARIAPALTDGRLSMARIRNIRASTTSTGHDGDATTKPRPGSPATSAGSRTSRCR
jgi:hypothetical protein